MLAALDSFASLLAHAGGVRATTMESDDITKFLLSLYFLSPFILGLILYVLYFKQTKLDYTASIQEALWPCLKAIGIFTVLVIVLLPFMVGGGHSHGGSSGSLASLPFLLFFLVPPYCIIKLYSVWQELSAAKKRMMKYKENNNPKKTQRKW